MRRRPRRLYRFRPVSLKDVAKRAQVDPSTVSRALRRNPWIPRHTQERIKQIANEMGYIPNANARWTAGAKIGAVGLCLPSLSFDAATYMAQGIDRRARERGYRLLVATFNNDRVQERMCVQDFQERRMEGIIVLGALASGPYFEASAVNIVPTVLVGTASRFGNHPPNGDRRVHAGERILATGSETFDVLYWMIKGKRPPPAPRLLTLIENL